VKVYNICIGDIYYHPGHIDENNNEIKFGYALKVVEKANFGDYFYWCINYTLHGEENTYLCPNLKMKNTVDFGVKTNMAYVNEKLEYWRAQHVKELLLEMK
jgi:hypothetical protein